VDRFIAEFKHSDCICQIELCCSSAIRHTEKLWTAMQVPFPELAVLHVSVPNALYKPDPDLPDSFLGGSAPRLQYLSLAGVSFPGLPNLLLSATRLVHLNIFYTTCSGYISPEAMAICLSVLTSLEELHLRFQFPQIFPDQESRRPPPPTRFVLPALTEFWFKGVNKYSEDLVSRIDAPRLYRLSTTLFIDIDFDTPELNQFIGRTPRFGAYNEARLIIDGHYTLVRLQSYPDSEQSDRGMVEVGLLDLVPVRRHLSLVQICTSSLRFLLTMDNLYIYEEDSLISPLWTGSVKSTDWLDLLLPFTAVKNLYLSEIIWQYIVSALQELTEGRTTEVLPALENVLLEGFQPSEPVQEGIAEFISARQLANRPVAISFWDRD
jgi:hypothetical protein